MAARRSCRPRPSSGWPLIALDLGRGRVPILNTERERVGNRRDRGSTSNLARVFEEQIVRTIKANDRILRSLQLSSVERNVVRPILHRWVGEIDESDGI